MPIQGAHFSQGKIIESGRGESSAWLRIGRVMEIVGCRMEVSSKFLEQLFMRTDAYYT